MAALFFVPLAAGDLKKPQLDRNSSEGQFMELISLEGDTAKKTALLEQFLTLFPKIDPSVTAWIYGELQDRYRRSGALDKAIGAGEKVLQIDPDNIEVARMNWRLAETKKDEALVKLWSEETARIAERIVKAPIPSDPEAMKAAEERALYAKQFIVNTDFQDYMAAIQTKDPAQRIAALDEFVKKSPQNPYMAQIEIAVFLALRELGDIDKTLAAAETVLARDENREDAMLFVAEMNFRRKKNTQRTFTLATKFIERMSIARKPEEMPDDQWTRTRNQNLALAYFIIGSIHFQSERWSAVDKAFRAALPYAPNDSLRATLLYQLGWANYKMQYPMEAIQFYKQCASIAGPMQEQASKNVVSVKAEYNLP